MKTILQQFKEHRNLDRAEFMTELAKITNSSVSYVTQVYYGYKNFSPRKARLVEKALNGEIKRAELVNWGEAKPVPQKTSTP